MSDVQALPHVHLLISIASEIKVPRKADTCTRVGDTSSEGLCYKG